MGCTQCCNTSHPCSKPPVPDATLKLMKNGHLLDPPPTLTSAAGRKRDATYRHHADNVSPMISRLFMSQHLWIRGLTAESLKLARTQGVMPIPVSLVKCQLSKLPFQGSSTQANAKDSRNDSRTLVSTVRGWVNLPDDEFQSGVID